MEEKIKIEELLKCGNTVQFHPQGISMYPLFVSPKDYAIVAPFEGKIKRGDVAVYRSAEGKLVIHRVVKVAKESIYCAGDRAKDVEPGVSFDEVYGIMTGFIRKGHKYSVTNPLYVFSTKLWLFLRPFRHFLFKCGHILKKICGISQ